MRYKIAVIVAGVIIAAMFGLEAYGRSAAAHYAASTDIIPQHVRMAILFAYSWARLRVLAIPVIVVGTLLVAAVWPR